MADPMTTEAAGETLARREAQKQWEANPCGASTVRDVAPETLEWFREARRVRYDEYAPWLRATTGIEHFHGKDVLEIGVGLGSDHFTLASGGNRMTALDLSREHLRLTQRHLSLEGLSTTAVHGDMEKMPFPDASFDLVYSFGVLHHTDHMEKAVAEIRRVLRPGGRAIIGVYHRDSVFFWLSTVAWSGILKGGFRRDGWARTLARIEAGAGDDYVPTVRALSRHKVRKLFEQFQVASVRTAGVMPDDFLHFQFIVRKLSRATLERVFGWLGWYLVVAARKEVQS
jgi:ubiquinone/menaquinone biosynthesis C-methylase UbiE